jgi:hypothetical protein
VPGFVEFHLLNGPEVEDHTPFMLRTLFGKAVLYLKRGLSRRHFGPRITRPAVRGRVVGAKRQEIGCL